ncbi:hypothetical protein IIA79_03445 [bacterium]|nr:hypothetical protein [bacterium]
MSYLPPHKDKSRQIRERYRKLRRRQVAAVAGLLVMSALAVLLIFATVMALRSCTGAWLGGDDKRALGEGEEDRWARLGGTHQFQLAPWFVALDSSALYIVQSTTSLRGRSPLMSTARDGRSTGTEGQQVDVLAAYPLAGGGPIWQSEATYELFGLGLAGGALFGYRQHASSPPSLEFVAFDAAGGSETWSIPLKDASEGSLIIEGKTALVGYRLPDGYRLVGYIVEAEFQTKVLGKHLPFAGLSDDLLNMPGASERMALVAQDGFAAYHLANVAGIVEISTGKLLREYAGAGYIYNVQLDAATRTCYILAAAEGPGKYILRALPFDGGAPSDLYRFDSASEEVLMLAEAGYLVLSYAVPEEGSEQPVPKLVCFSGRESTAVLTHRFDAGVISDVALLQESSGGYLAALNQGIGDDGAYRGASELFWVDLVEETVTRVARQKAPVLYLAPFKGDCLVLLQGGSILSFDSGDKGARRIRKARYPYLEPVLSPGKERLAILSYPRAYLEGEGGQPMQVLIYE